MGVLAFLQRLLRYLQPYGASSALILMGLLLEAGFSSGVSIAFKFLIDHAIVPGGQQVLSLILGLLVAGAVLVALVGLGRDYLYAQVCAAIMRELRWRMFRHLQRLSMGFYARTQAGDIIARFSTDLAAVENALTTAIPWAGLPALEILISTVLLFVLEWRLALVAMLIFPLSLIGPKVFAPRASAASYQRKQHEASLVAAVQEDLGTQAAIKAFGLEQKMQARFAKHLGEVARSSLRVGFLSALVGRSAGISILVLQVLVMGVGAYMAFSSHLSIGTLVSFQALFMTLSWSLLYVTEYVPNLVQAVGGMQRIEELLEEVPQVADAPDATPLPRLSKEIAFEDVKFGYTGDRFILDGVSFTIGAGEAVAVVGQSGSGKSTILNLLTRFYDPTEGRVSIDGYDLQHVTQESLRAQIGIVFQDSVLFNTTVRENLRAGKPDATDAEIEAAAHAADLHAVIEALPFGYDTLVGERGGWLSGGQRQRVAIARAILRNPAILVLDEVTSALDAGTEAAIHDTLRRAARDRTVVLVTHRLALAAHLDQVVVLDQGRVAELGTHDELLERRGLYTRLWQLQGGFVISADGRYAEVVPRRLRAIPLFENVDDKTLEALAEQFVAEQYEAGEQIIAEGEPGERFYLIVRGKVAVTTTGTEGKTVHLAVLEDGDYFGEIALIEEGAQPATVHTRLPSIVLSLHRRHFMQMLQRNTALQKAIEQTALDRSLNLVTSRGRRARSSSSLQDLHSSD